MPRTGTARILIHPLSRRIPGAILIFTLIPASTTPPVTTSGRQGRTANQTQEMTLEIGYYNKSPSQCVFTLIELIMVMALLVVAVCLVAPRMSDFIRGRALDSEARRLM